MRNCALGHEDGLLDHGQRRKLPTDDRHEGDFWRVVSDAERRRPFDPPHARAGGTRRSHPRWSRSGSIRPTPVDLRSARAGTAPLHLADSARCGRHRAGRADAASRSVRLRAVKARIILDLGSRTSLGLPPSGTAGNGGETVRSGRGHRSTLRGWPRHSTCRAGPPSHRGLPIGTCGEVTCDGRLTLRCVNTPHSLQATTTTLLLGSGDRDSQGAGPARPPAHDHDANLRQATDRRLRKRVRRCADLTC